MSIVNLPWPNYYRKILTVSEVKASVILITNEIAFFLFQQEWYKLLHTENRKCWADFNIIEALYFIVYPFHFIYIIDNVIWHNLSTKAHNITTQKQIKIVGLIIEGSKLKFTIFNWFFFYNHHTDVFFIKLKSHIYVKVYYHSDTLLY